MMTEHVARHVYNLFCVPFSPYVHVFLHQKLYDIDFRNSKNTENTEKPIDNTRLQITKDGNRVQTVVLI